MISDENNILILAAGRGIGIDGFHKLNLVYPETKEKFLFRYMRQFNSNAKVVVGYRAAEIMSSYPDLKYVYNYSWFETGSAFSAYLGLDSVPIIVLPADLVISDDMASQIIESKGNTIFGLDTENRSQSSANISHIASNVTEIYNGAKLNGSDKEFSGIIKISSQPVLNELSEICEKNSEFYLSECLAQMTESFKFELLQGDFTEVNTIDDYVKMFEERT